MPTKNKKDTTISITIDNKRNEISEETSDSITAKDPETSEEYTANCTWNLIQKIRLCGC